MDAGSDTTAKEPAIAAPVQFGKYELIELLGRGGMAEAWRARITGPAGFERMLVVKRIRGELSRDPQFVEMFLREARLSARLHHVNIVQVNELGECDGEYFLAMEFVQGLDLATAMRKLGARHPLPPAFGAFIVREVARALSFAHGLADADGNPLRIVHRDVSPSNVMLGADGGVKLLDFGIAKALAQGTGGTAVGRLKGKFGYMAPEQLDGRSIDHRVDVFAAGVVLHELLTGRHLFQRANAEATIEAVRQGAIEPPSATNPEVPPELDRICARALARKRGERYSSADELQRELDEVLHKLRWGQAQLSELVRSLDDATAPRLPTLNRTLSSSAKTTGRARRRLLFAGAALVVGIGLGMAVMHLRAPRRTNPSASPAAPELARPAPPPPGPAHAAPAPPPFTPPAPPPAEPVREAPPPSPLDPPPPNPRPRDDAKPPPPRRRDETKPPARLRDETKPPAHGKQRKPKLRDIEHGATMNPF